MCERVRYAIICVCYECERVVATAVEVLFTHAVVKKKISKRQHAGGKALLLSSLSLFVLSTSEHVYAELFPLSKHISPRGFALTRRRERARELSDRIRDIIPTDRSLILTYYGTEWSPWSVEATAASVSMVQPAWIDDYTRPLKDKKRYQKWRETNARPVNTSCLLNQQDKLTWISTDVTS